MTAIVHRGDGAVMRRDRCVSPGCETPTDPAEWPVVCRLCTPAINDALDDYWAEHEPEMAELHHECVAEEAGYATSRCGECGGTLREHRCEDCGTRHNGPEGQR